MRRSVLRNIGRLAKPVTVLILAFAAVLSQHAVAEEPSRQTRVEVTSEPSGATIAVDGQDRGVTPLVMYDLKPGRHLLKCRLAGYEERDRFVNVEAGVPLQRNAMLEPVKGILLLKSDPAGAKIFIDGLSVGETPRLITTLNAKDVHKVTLKKVGYRPSTFDVRLDGRTPLVREETLLLDSAVLSVTSDPPGASVVVNGIERGVTPITVKDVPKGVASVRISRAGFQDEVREITLRAGDSPTLAVTLKGLPGTLRLSSVPEGARLYVNDAFVGKAPYALTKVEPGKYTVRAELEGYGTATREVTVGNGSAPSVDFRLSNTMGRLEIRSWPPGATVLLDGKTMGVTKAANADAEKSDVFAIPNVLAGEHQVVLRREGYVEYARTVKAVEMKTHTVNAHLKRFFKPDVEFETPSGKTCRAVFVKGNDDEITVEVSLGMIFTYKRTEVRNFRFIEDPAADGAGAKGKSDTGR